MCCELGSRYSIAIALSIAFFYCFFVVLNVTNFQQIFQFKVQINFPTENQQNIANLTQTPKRTVSNVARKNPAPRIWNGSCSEITVRTHHGRLGNQMFAYASLYGLAVLNDRKPYLGFGNLPLLSPFDKLTIPRTPPAGKANEFQAFENRREGVFDTHLLQMPCNRKVILTGYMHSYKYFASVSDEIRSQFHFNQSVLSKCQQSIREHRTSRNCTVIAAHLRTKPGNTRQGGYPASGEFLSRAVRFLRNRLSNDTCLKFVLLGNDYEWNLANSPKAPDVIVPTLQSAPIDLCILASADHVIITVGTYSFWAGFLNKGIVVYQRERAKKGSTIDSAFKTSDYYLPHWIGM